ncbi:hypothetical protein D9K64_12730 [Klebsiella pneumoniae]|nr:hypothetical protein D9K64_12730 [Klebsiella pneumoniae]
MVNAMLLCGLMLACEQQDCQYGQKQFIHFLKIIKIIKNIEKIFSYALKLIKSELKCTVCGWLTCVVIHLKNKKSNKNLKIGIAVKYRFIKLVIPFIAQSLLL